jgi:hypothetical protein
MSKQDWMGINDIYKVHEWEKTILIYEYFQDLIGNYWEMTKNKQENIWIFSTFNGRWLRNEQEWKYCYWPLMTYLTHSHLLFMKDFL